MNKLPFEKRRQIIHAMVEGNSVRGIARLVDVSPVTVLRFSRWLEPLARNFTTRAFAT
jgi:transposase-like protein